MTRRQDMALGLLLTVVVAVSGLALIYSYAFDAQAETPEEPSMTEDYSEDLSPLEERLEQWDVQHFTAEELVYLKNDDWEGPSHVCPPPRVLGHMSLTIQTADVIREVWDRHHEDGRIRVTSGYRPNAYNMLVGGKPASCHKYFRALDLQPYNGKIDEFYLVVDAVISTLDARGISTGFGLYPTFVHIDTLATTEHKSHKRRWDERGTDEEDTD